MLIAQEIVSIAITVWQELNKIEADLTKKPQDRESHILKTFMNEASLLLDERNPFRSFSDLVSFSSGTVADQNYVLNPEKIGECELQEFVKNEL